MVADYITIHKDDYDKMKRAETALDFIYMHIYKEGYNYGVSGEIEAALRLIYDDKITALKTIADLELEEWRKKKENTKEDENNETV